MLAGWLRQTFIPLHPLAATALWLGMQFMVSAEALADEGNLTPAAADTQLPSLARPERCPLNEALVTDGQRRLALLVGVQDYRGLQGLYDLSGPVNDVDQMYDLLTGENGYGFPKENVCVLLEEDATVVKVKAFFDAALTQRVNGPDDLIVLYYAGHGSQLVDRDGDETQDHMDETFVLYGADQHGNEQLTDDEFGRMLGSLREKTSKVVLIFDSCNSGSVNRGPAKARWVPPQGRTPPISSGAPTSPLLEQQGTGPRGAEQTQGFVEDLPPETVVLSAAIDGTSAYEDDEKGVFTDAFVRAAYASDSLPRTYAQIERAVEQATSSFGQIPDFKGDLDRVVFENTERTRPLGWEIAEVGPPVKLVGAPMSGWSAGAKLRAYGGGVTVADTRDPAKAKANLEIVELLNPYSAVAKILGSPQESLAVGDLVTLLQPGSDLSSVAVRMRPGHLPGGIVTEVASKVRDAITKLAGRVGGVELTDGPADFELALQDEGKIALIGPEGATRYASSNPARVARAAWLHSQQRKLLLQEGQGGLSYVNNETLQASIVPDTSQDNSCAEFGFLQASLGETQLIPECFKWKLQVRMAPEAYGRLRVGALYLSNDGSIYSFNNGHYPVLEPDQSWVFARGFTSTPPLGVLEHILVFGTRADAPVVRWEDLERTPDTDRAAGRRGTPTETTELADAWTSTHLVLIPSSLTTAIPGAE